MGRIIDGQIIASTRLDAHGERLEREELEALFARLPDEILSGVNHDVSQPPICRAFNKRLELQNDGETVVRVDVEVFDEELFSTFGGFSIAFSRRRIRIGHGDAVVEVSVNPQQFDIQDVVNAVGGINGETGTADVVERIEKGRLLETAIVSIAVFVGLQTFGGFFNAAGAALFELFRRQKRSDKPSGPVSIQFHLHLEGRYRVPVVVLAVEPGCTVSDIRSIDGHALLALVEARFGQARIQKVAGRVLHGGIVEIDHVTAYDGRLIYDNSSET